MNGSLRRTNQPVDAKPHNKNEAESPYITGVANDSGLTDEDPALFIFILKIFQKIYITG